MILAAGLAFTVYMRYFTFVFMIVSMMAGAVVYLVFARRREGPGCPPQDAGRARWKRYALLIAFMLLYAQSLFSLALADYDKPIVYYVLIALCVGLVALDVFMVRTRSDSIVSLVKIQLLAANVFLGDQLAFTFGIGASDSWKNIYDINNLLIGGHIPADAAYARNPGHLALVAAGSLFSGIGTPGIYYLLGGLAMASVAAFLFIVGRRFVGEKFGLFAALVFTCSDYVVYWGSHVHQFSFALLLVVVSFTAFLYFISTKNKTFLIVFLIAAIALIFSHQYSTMVLFFILVGVLAATLVRWRTTGKLDREVLWLVLLFGIAFIAQWVYYSRLLNIFVNILMSYMKAIGHTAIAAATNYDVTPLATILVNTLGSAVLFFFAAIGFFYAVEGKKFFGHAVSLISVFLLALIGVGYVLPASGLLPQRLYAVLETVGLTFLASFAIIRIAEGRAPALKAALVIALVVFSFFSTASFISGFETSPFYGQPYLKLFQTSSERSSMEWIASFGNASYAFYKSPSTQPSSLSYWSQIIGQDIRFNDAILPLDLSTPARINFSRVRSPSYIAVSGYDYTIGFKVPKAYNPHMGTDVYSRLNDNDTRLLAAYPRIFDSSADRVYQVPGELG